MGRMECRRRRVLRSRCREIGVGNGTMNLVKCMLWSRMAEEGGCKQT